MFKERFVVNTYAITSSQHFPCLLRNILISVVPPVLSPPWFRTSIILSCIYSLVINLCSISFFSCPKLSFKPNRYFSCLLRFSSFSSALFLISISGSLSRLGLVCSSIPLFSDSSRTLFISFTSVQAVFYSIQVLTIEGMRIRTCFHNYKICY